MLQRISFVFLSLFIFLSSCTSVGSNDPTDTTDFEERIQEMENIIQELNNRITELDEELYSQNILMQDLEQQKQEIEELRQELISKIYSFDDDMVDHTWGGLGFIEIVEKEGELFFVVQYCATARILGYSLSNIEPHIRETPVVFAQIFDTALLGNYQIEIHFPSIFTGISTGGTAFRRLYPIGIVQEIIFVPEEFEGQFNLFRYSPYSHGLTLLIGSDLPIIVEESEFTELPILNNRIEIPLGIRR